MTFNQARNLFPSQLAVLALASAIAIPASAQQGQSASGSQDNPPSTTQQQPSPTAKPLENQSKEGFWGRMNPMASKKWVKRKKDQIKDTLAQSGIRQAQ